MRRRLPRGFTLIELAVVLVIVALLLSMVLKGRALIDVARLRTVQAQYNKVSTAITMWSAESGRLPGDLNQNGQIDTPDEVEALWQILVQRGLLTSSDRLSQFGVPWGIQFDEGAHWLTAEHADVRWVCQIDARQDDGQAPSGDIRLTPAAYDPTTPDCWALDGYGALRWRLLF